MTSGRTPSCEFDTGDLSVRLSAVLSGDVAEVQPAVDRVMAVIADMGCVSGDEFAVELALLEALANAVEHGCRHDPCKTVQLCVACDPDRGVLIVVRDPGGGFDPASLPDVTTGERLYATGGRGIFLINRLMDEVSYEEGGTVIRMRKAPRRADG